MLTAQKLSLNTLLSKANYKSGLAELQKKLETYAATKPENIVLSGPGQLHILLFKPIGIGISNQPFSCQDCIGTVIAYPPSIKEVVPFLAVKPNADVDYVCKAMQQNQESIESIQYYKERRELYIVLLNYYFIVEKIDFKPTSEWSTDKSYDTKEPYYYIKDKKQIKTYVASFKKLKVAAVLTAFPAPMAAPLD